MGPGKAQMSSTAEGTSTERVFGATELPSRSPWNELDLKRSHGMPFQTCRGGGAFDQDVDGAYLSLMLMAHGAVLFKTGSNLRLIGHLFVDLRNRSTFRNVERPVTSYPLSTCFFELAPLPSPPR